MGNFDSYFTSFTSFGLLCSCTNTTLTHQTEFISSKCFYILENKCYSLMLCNLSQKFCAVRIVTGEFFMRYSFCLSTETYILRYSNFSFPKTKVQLMNCLARRLAGGFSWQFVSNWCSRRTTQYTVLTRLFTVWFFFLQASGWFTNCVICWRVG